MTKKLSTKKPLLGNRVSKSKRATKHAQKPNFKKVTLDDGQRVVLSVREARTLKKTEKKTEE